MHINFNVNISNNHNCITLLYMNNSREYRNRISKRQHQNTLKEDFENIYYFQNLQFSSSDVSFGPQFLILLHLNVFEIQYLFLLQRN